MQSSVESEKKWIYIFDFPQKFNCSIEFFFIFILQVTTIVVREVTTKFLVPFDDKISNLILTVSRTINYRRVCRYSRITKNWRMRWNLLSNIMISHLLFAISNQILNANIKFLNRFVKNTFSTCIKYQKWKDKNNVFDAAFKW